jgi:hypothetical protein
MAMDEQRQRRGSLLVEREEIERDIETTTRQLAELGDSFMRLGSELKSRPDRITFKNVPSGIENRIPDLLQDQPSFDWNATDCHIALTLTVRLRHLKDRLRSVTADLATDMAPIRVAR